MKKKQTPVHTSSLGNYRQLIESVNTMTKSLEEAQRAIKKTAETAYSFLKDYMQGVFGFIPGVMIMDADDCKWRFVRLEVVDGNQLPGMVEGSFVVTFYGADIDGREGRIGAAHVINEPLQIIWLDNGRRIELAD